MASLRAAQAAVAAERFRIERGRFPQSLEELVPELLNEVPIDPFDAKPLRLLATEQGIVIYSVDENLSDDQGDVVDDSGGPRARDIGFRLLRPEHRGVRIVEDAASVGDR